LSPALCALLLKPRSQQRGPLRGFYRGFNRMFERATAGYVSLSHALIRKSVLALVILVAFGVAGGWFGQKLPRAFLPEEDQGYIYVGLQLPNAASLERTAEAARKVEDVLKATPGVQGVTSIIG